MRIAKAVRMFFLFGGSGAENIGVAGARWAARLILRKKLAKSVIVEKL